MFTPLATIWYGAVSGLSRDLAAFSILPGALLVLLPFLEAVLSYERGILVRSHRTAPISVAVGVQLAVTTGAFVLMVLVLKTAGAVSIGPALTLGYAIGVAILVMGRRGNPAKAVPLPDVLPLVTFRSFSCLFRALFALLTFIFLVLTFVLVVTVGEN